MGRFSLVYLEKKVCHEHSWEERVVAGGESLYFENTINHHSHFSTKRSAWRNLLRTIKSSSGNPFGITFIKDYPPSKIKILTL